MHIFLVRHGRSLANDDQRICQEIADHAIPLSDRGHKQAEEVGKFLNHYLQDNNISKPVRLWVSPYKRTRQTADEIIKVAPIISERREHINLVEQNFGLFDGIPEDQLPIEFPREYAHYKRCEDHGGRFYARMPMGESRFDVAIRIHEMFGTFHRDAEKKGINTIVVVCHGVILRTFVMQWLHLTPEWFEEEKNPKNCAVRLLVDNKDHGYIYEGGIP